MSCCIVVLVIYCGSKVADHMERRTESVLYRFYLQACSIGCLSNIWVNTFFLGKVLRGTTRGEWRKVHNKEHHNLCT